MIDRIDVHSTLYMYEAWCAVVVRMLCEGVAFDVDAVLYCRAQEVQSKDLESGEDS